MLACSCPRANVVTSSDGEAQHLALRSTALARPALLPRAQRLLRVRHHGGEHRRLGEELRAENALLWDKINSMEARLHERGEALGTVSGRSTRASSVVKPELISDFLRATVVRSRHLPRHSGTPT